MRNKVQQNGIHSLTDVEFLEYILFYVYKRENTNEIAHSLLNKFKTISGVFSASYESLMEIDGVGPVAAGFIRDLPVFSERILTDSYLTNDKLDHIDKVIDFLKGIFLNTIGESGCTLYLNGSLELIEYEVTSQDAFHEVSVNQRNILKKALQVNAPYIIFSHNHPSCNPTPSTEDCILTTKLKNALKTVDIELLDHIILCPDGRYYSFTANQ